MSQTKTLPCAIIHTAPKCVEGVSVQIEGYVVELRHGENLGIGVPVMIGPCQCAGGITDIEMRRLTDLAIEQLAPAHFLRQVAVAEGGELAAEKQVLDELKIGHTKLWELIGEGALPEPMKRGTHNVWLLAEMRRAYARTLTVAVADNKRAPVPSPIRKQKKGS